MSNDDSKTAILSRTTYNIQKKFELSTTRPDIIRAFLALFAKALYERSK